MRTIALHFLFSFLTCCIMHCYIHKDRLTMAFSFLFPISLHSISWLAAALPLRISPYQDQLIKLSLICQNELECALTAITFPPLYTSLIAVSASAMSCTQQYSLTG